MFVRNIENLVNQYLLKTGSFVVFSMVKTWLLATVSSTGCFVEIILSKLS